MANPYWPCARVAVSYRSDPQQWNEHLLLERLEGTRWVALVTDMVVVDLDLAAPRDGIIRAVRAIRDDGTVLGVDRDNLFTFVDAGDELREEDYDAWIAEGKNHGVLLRGGHGLAPDDTSGSAHLHPPSTGGTAGLVSQALQAIGIAPSGWIFSETRGEAVLGAAVDNQLAVTAIDDRGLVRLPSGICVGVHRPGTMETPSDDKRTFGKFNSSGTDEIEFIHAVDKLVETKFPNSPVAGPTSAIWLMKYVVRNGGSALAFHSKFMNECRLDYGANGALEHLSICKFFELALTFDKINVGSSVCCELMARKMQIIHERWKHKLPSFNPSGSGSVDDDTYLLLGTYETRGNLAVCPALQEWVGQELAKEALAAKERRKAREEWALSAKAK